MSRERIKEIVAEMQKGGPNVNQLVKELLEIKKTLGDPVPSISASKLKGDWKLERRGLAEDKPKRKTRKKRAPKAKKDDSK
jgi:hypothetical protein